MSSKKAVKKPTKKQLATYKRALMEAHEIGTLVAESKKGMKALKAAKKPKQTITKPDKVITVPDKEPQKIQLQQEAKCAHCKKIIPRGDLAFWIRSYQEGAGLYHLTCYPSDKTQVLAGSPQGPVCAPPPEQPESFPKPSVIIFPTRNGELQYVDASKVSRVCRYKYNDGDTLVDAGGTPFWTTLKVNEVLKLLGWETPKP